MRITTTFEAETATIVLGERLDGQNSPKLRAFVQSQIADHPEVRAVVVDFAGCPFVDSSGMGVLMGLKAHLGARDITLRVANPTHDVQRIFALMRMDKIFGVGG